MSEDAKPKWRILFVDDEPSIRMTMPLILEKHGFHVTVAPDVPEALSLIASQPFDLLISDLNIGSPGDGFTLVSAMRRTQPHAKTFILTGYPAFETALEAIRSQVDDYLTKPTDVQQLVRAITQSLSAGVNGATLRAQRLWAVLRDNREQVVAAWLDGTRHLSTPDGPMQDKLSSIPALLDQIVESARYGESMPGEQVVRSRQHGQDRYRLGYQVPMLVDETAILSQTIYDLTEEKLLRIEVSYVIPDLKLVDAALDTHLRHAIEGYMEAARQAA